MHVCFLHCPCPILCVYRFRCAHSFPVIVTVAVVIITRNIKSKREGNPKNAILHIESISTTTPKMIVFRTGCNFSFESAFDSFLFSFCCRVHVTVSIAVVWLPTFNMRIHIFTCHTHRGRGTHNGPLTWNTMKQRSDFMRQRCIHRIKQKCCAKNKKAEHKIECQTPSTGKNQSKCTSKTGRSFLAKCVLSSIFIILKRFFMNVMDNFVYLSFLLSHGCVHAVQRVYMAFIALRLVYIWIKTNFVWKTKMGNFQTKKCKITKRTVKSGIRWMEWQERAKKSEKSVLWNPYRIV